MPIANAENRLPKPDTNGLLDYTGFKGLFYDRYYLTRSLGINTADHVCYCPTNDRLYVTRQVPSGEVIVVNPKTFATVTTIAVSVQPEMLAYCPTNNRIYVANAGVSGVSVINPVTNTVVVTIGSLSTPMGVSFASHTGNIYVSSTTAGAVYVINPATNSVISTISGLSNAQSGTQAVGKFLYVNRGVSGLSKIDLDTNTVVATLAITTQFDFTYCPTTNELYVPGGANNIRVIDLETFTVKATITSAGDNANAGYAPSIDRVFVSQQSPSANLRVINPSTKSIVATLTMTGEGIKYCPSTDKMILCNRAGNTIQEISFI